MRYFVFGFLVNLAYADNVELYKFRDFMKTYNKSYTSAELMNKYNTFMNNLNIINDNKNLGINKYADLNKDEFKEHISSGCLYDSSNKEKTTCNKISAVSNNTNLPESIDWRDKNAVTDVKNQGKCGSCWSFSATGALEGAWAIANNDLISLSEQQLIDCSLSYGNLACHGGLMDNAFEYAIDNGMCKESEDPYEADLESCASCETAAYFSHCEDIPSGNQLLLKQAVAKGPVAVAIEADTRVFQLYKTGIITSETCGTELDHGVLIVGYGEEDGVLYWLVKNSWGEDWGQDGYVKILRSEKEDDVGVCGIAQQASQPIATLL